MTQIVSSLSPTGGRILPGAFLMGVLIFASNLISDMLAESPSVLFRAEQFLHGPCFCQSASHTGDPTCEENVSAILPDTLLAMSRLVQNQTLLCGDDSSGQGGTCEQCQEEAGGVTYS